VLELISHLRRGAALTVVVAAGLVLAGCGTGHPKPLTGTAALDAKIRDAATSFTGVRGTKASCVYRTCTLAWNERVHDTHESWLIARTVIASLDDSYYRPMRRFTLRISDHHTERLWSFACRAEYPRSPNFSDAHWPHDQCVQTARPLT
jgi:hypothetical protein